MRFRPRRAPHFGVAARTAILALSITAVVASAGGFVGRRAAGPRSTTAVVLPSLATVVAASLTPAASATASPTPTPSPTLAATATATATARTAPPRTPAPRPPTPTPQPPSTSGSAMPTGNLPGWRLTYAQDFNGSSLPPRWGAYSGEPGGDSHGWWNPSNLTVSGGYLHFNGRYDPSVGRYSTAGVSFGGDNQTYGMYLVRMKGNYDPGVSISDIALLWPAANSWPPEIDFFEDPGGTRSSTTATLHPGPNGIDCCQVARSLALDATQWHTVGVQWTPNTISYMVDGRVWATVSAGQLPPGGHWPAQAMSLDLQAQNLSSSYPPGPTENMTVDWVVEYTPA